MDILNTLNTVSNNGLPIFSSNICLIIMAITSCLYLGLVWPHCTIELNTKRTVYTTKKPSFSGVLLYIAGLMKFAQLMLINEAIISFELNTLLWYGLLEALTFIVVVFGFRQTIEITKNLFWKYDLKELPQGAYYPLFLGLLFFSILHDPFIGMTPINWTDFVHIPLIWVLTWRTTSANGYVAVIVPLVIAALAIYYIKTLFETHHISPENGNLIWQYFNVIWQSMNLKSLLYFGVPLVSTFIVFNLLVKGESPTNLKFLNKIKEGLPKNQFLIPIALFIVIYLLNPLSDIIDSKGIILALGLFSVLLFLFAVWFYIKTSGNMWQTIAIICLVLIVNMIFPIPKAHQISLANGSLMTQYLNIIWQNITSLFHNVIILTPLYIIIGYLTSKNYSIKLKFLNKIKNILPPSKQPKKEQ